MYFTSILTVFVGCTWNILIKGHDKKQLTLFAMPKDRRSPEIYIS